MKRDTFYFPHDFHARNDLKLLKLKERAGLEGIGFYWCITELLHENGGTFSPDVGDVAVSLQIDSGNARVLLEHCHTLGLIEVGERLSMKRVTENLKAREVKRRKRQEAGRKGGLAKALSSNAKGTSSKGLTKPSKGKERKGKDKKEEPYPKIVQTWLKYRREIKKPVAQASRAALLRRYEKDPAQFEADVEYSIQQGYQGLYSPRGNQASAIKKQETIKIDLGG